LTPLVELFSGLNETLTGLKATPVVLEQHLNSRFGLLGMQGLVAMAVAGIEMATWDALGKAAGLPLVR
jgi:mandelate racemase